MLDDMIETIGPTRSRREDAVTKALREDLAAAQDGIAAKAPNEDLELDASAAERQVLCTPEYRLWIRCENTPQSGHGQALTADRVRTTT